MLKLWKATESLVLEMVEALMLLPLYLKVVVALVLAAWIVVVADWDEFFPQAAQPAPVSSSQPVSPEPVKAVAASTEKVDDRMPAAAPSPDMTGKFLIADPRVAPDGSITDGESGTPFFLADLKSFSAKDVCTRADGERWACGLHAYATLRNSIVHKTIQCTNNGSRDEPRISCALAGKNIALFLVDNGLVELKDSARDPELQRAEAKAKSSKAGIWNRQEQATARQ